MLRTLLALLVSAPLTLAVPSLASAAPRKVQARTHAPRHAPKRGKRRAAPVRELPAITRAGLPNVQAHAAVVVDITAGPGKEVELYQRNPDEVRPIASISKLMAMMVVLDRNLNLDATTTMIDEDRKLALRGARSRLPPGAQLTNRDLLHAALMASDNRAVLALGRAVGLDPEHFTLEMNRKAQALGLVHTAFGDPTGLDARNVSTPREVAKMLQIALANPLITTITRKATYVAHATGTKGRSWPIDYQNTDVFARGKRFSVLGGKTGYTDLAGYCLVIAARLDEDRSVVMAFLGEQGKMTRFADFSRTAQWIAEKKPASRSGTPGTQTASNAPAPSSAPAAEPAHAPAAAPASDGVVKASAAPSSL